MKPLVDWMDRHKVVVCLGPGGVGKTTVTSALGILGARSGSRTLCLTIDPARRLAESLGVQAASGGHEGMVEVPVSDNLWVMMVDATSAVDVATRRHLDPADQADFEENRIFRYLRNTLAGFHEFASMDVLMDLVDRGLWDRIILDTPPSQHARDFLEAPQRIERTVTSPVLNLFVDAGGRGLPGRGIVGVGTGMTMRVIGRLIGRALVEEVAEFLILGGDMLKGFHDRSIRMQEFLRRGDLGFAIITSPETVPECIRVHAMLVEMGFSSEVFFANRVLPYARDDLADVRLSPLSPGGDVRPAPGPAPITVSGELGRKIGENYESSRRLSEVQLKTLRDLARKVGDPHDLYVIPQMAEDVFDLPALERVLDSIMVLESDADPPTRGETESAHPA